jgi:REP element-mobilizing transposase RayT
MKPKFDPQKHHRQSTRLQGYDYSLAGAYFVTIVAWHRECLFGEIVNGEMKLNDAGKIVQWEWLELPKRLQYIELGAYVVMPNHFHGILIFLETAGATRHGLSIAISEKTTLPNMTTDSTGGSPLPRGPKPTSLGAVMSQFKSRVTKRLWKIPSLKDTPIWQRNFHDRIIRNEQEMDAIWRYIEANPSAWEDDEENLRRIQP